MGTSLYGLTPAATYQGLIKFGNNSAIAATAQYLSDGLGNDLPISVSTTKVGINTTNPTARLQINEAITNNVLKLVNSGDITQYFTFYQGTPPNFWDIGPVADDGNTILRMYRNNYIVTRVGGTEFMRQEGSGIGLFINGATPSARLQIKGSGSTSGTSSLLVQNSSAVNKISCNDDSTTLNLLSGVAGSSVAQVTIGAIATGTMFLEANVDGGTTGMRVHTNRQNTPIFFGCTSANTPTSDSITIGNSTNATGATHNIMFRQSNAVVGGFPNSANASYPSAQFFIESTTRGFLPPRMTDAQVRAIATPAVGLTCYNTDLDCPVFYSTAGWRKISHSAM